MARVKNRGWKEEENRFAIARCLVALVFMHEVQEQQSKPTVIDANV